MVEQWGEKMKTALLVMVSGLVLLVTGCVSTGEHEALKAQYETAENEKTDCENRVTGLQDQLEGMSSRNKALSSQNANLARENTELLAEKRKQEEQLRRQLETLESEIDQKTTQIRMIEDTLKIDIIERIFFKSGEAIVTPQGARIIKSIVPALKNTDQEIVIIGHADELPPNSELRKKYPSNWELSSARASAIVHILQWGYGIDPVRLIAQGVAHYRPLPVKELVTDDKITKKVIYKTNRAVEIVLRPRQEML